MPKYENRFLHVLHDFSQDQITIIASTIREAFREVKDKLELVNRSLMLSRYNRGIHLHIEARNIRPHETEEFLIELNAIARNAWNDERIEEAEQRYHSVAELIERLKAQTPADRRWRDLCLDTRKQIGQLLHLK